MTGPLHKRIRKKREHLRMTIPGIPQTLFLTVSMEWLKILRMSKKPRQKAARQPRAVTL